MDVKMKISTSGIPYIEFDKDNQIIFSKLTATQDGYKYLIIKADSFEKIKIDTKSGKKKTVTSNIKTNDQFSIEMDLKGIPNIITGTNPHFNKENMKKLKSVFKKYVINGIIPFASISLIEGELNKE